MSLRMSPFHTPFSSLVPQFPSSGLRRYELKLHFPCNILNKSGHWPTKDSLVTGPFSTIVLKVSGREVIFNSIPPRSALLSQISESQAKLALNFTFMFRFLLTSIIQKLKTNV